MRAFPVLAGKKSHRLTVASDLRTHIVPFFEGRPLEGIDADDIERYIDVKSRTLARRIRVVSPYVRGEFADPKSERSGRSVAMASRFADALEQLHAHTHYRHPRDLAFCHPESGKPLDRSKLVRRFKQAIERAGV